MGSGRILAIFVGSLISIILFVDVAPVIAQYRIHYRRRYIRRYPPPRRGFVYPRPRRRPVIHRSSVYLGFGGLADYVAQSSNQLTKLVNTGGGFNLFLGLRTNRYFAFEFGVLNTFHSTDPRFAPYDRGTMLGLTIDGKIFLLPNSIRIEPFFQVGGGYYGYYKNRYEGEELGGAGFHLGGGVDVRLNPRIAVGIRGLYKGAYLDNATQWHQATKSVYLNQIAIEANVQFHFF